MRLFRQITKRFGTDKLGATAVEYGLIMALMTLALVGALASTGQSTGNKWNNISEEVVTASEGAGV
ncbi:MAG: hypothetical protein Hens3KO_15590 [Henriciella sp.]